MRVKGFSEFLILGLLVAQCLCSSSPGDFDFSYFVQQWPASSCDTKRGCCYPTKGKPDEDFSIHGVWPNYNNGSWPHDCDSKNSLNQTQVSDLITKMEKDWPTLACPSANGVKFWKHEWKKHGTCTTLDQHTYFQAALDLKHKANLLQHLIHAGISPGNFYNVDEIKQAIEGGVGYEPFIECNVDLSGNTQLFQVYLCVDKSASDFIKCPIFPRGRDCGLTIEFPSFSSNVSNVHLKDVL